MQYSYSRVSLFKDCPYHFKLKYIDQLTEIKDFSPNSPLILGHALHHGIETNVDQMLDDYFSSFPVLTDEQINEAIKLEIMLPKVKDYLNEVFFDCELQHEYKIDTDRYLGFVDLIVTAPDGKCLVIDFKYSNNIENYLDSPQMHIYQHYLEQDGFKVGSLGYLFIQKVNIRQKKDEDLYHYRKRLIEVCKQAKVIFVPIEYDASKVDDFFQDIEKIESTKDYPRNVSGHCFSCAAIQNKQMNKWSVLTPPDFLETIQDKNGEIEMVLPSSERRNIEKVTKRVFWLYGAPFSGKTTFANDFPNPLMLNTDGNIRFVDAPYESITDEVIKNGRITETVKAWDKLKEKVFELEKDENDFQTIVVDLLEDTYQACRSYMYEKLGIEHESDNSFKAWDMVRNEFLNVIKRIVHLPYENIIFISHEDISKDITKKTGDKITAISPNLQDKAALKVAGMVDIVGRVVADDDERKIVFKSKDYVFGGGRLPNLPVTEINLVVDELIDVYDQANKGLKKSAKKASETKESDDSEEKDTVSETEPKKRRGRKAAEKTEEKDDVVDDETPPGESPATEEKSTNDEEQPKRKRRERKIEDVEESETAKEEPRRRRRERASK